MLLGALDRARRGGRVRIWSSACSTGQEPYTIALTILSILPDAANHDIKILATDIDPNVVATAKAGIYSQSEVEPVPAELVRRWMTKTPDGQFSVGEEMRALVSFRELNLIGPWPMKQTFDAIFCRNVVIYFDEATQREMWRRFRGMLQIGGRLYVGHSERVVGDGFRSDGLTTYVAEGARA